MNLLFANYGDFTANSLNHIGLFAAQLRRLGHTCIVAVPDKPETLASLPRPEFIPATFDELLAKPAFFPDGRGADLLHAWTPRENVRRFALAYRSLTGCRLVVHLEDNEEHLTEAQLQISLGEARSAAGLVRCETLAPALSHPVRFPFFLRCADGATVIVPTLRRFVPAGLPCAELPPGVDASLYRPLSPDTALREELGLASGEKVIVFTGSNTFANEAEIRALYEAVAELNRRGVPTTLLRTGLFSKTFTPPLPEELVRHVKDLGFVEKGLLPRLLSLADLCAQPGAPGPFNDFRLPSKIPELLAMGLPLVLPASNVGLQLRHREQAWVMQRGDAADIVEACLALFQDPDLAARIGRGGLDYARAQFDLAANTGRLLAFYETCLSSPLHPGLARGEACSELALALRGIAARAHAGADATMLAELEPMLAYLEETQQKHVALKPIHEALERRFAELADKARDQEASLTNARERQELSNQHIANLEAIIADLRRVQASLLVEQAQERQQALVEKAALTNEREVLKATLAAREAKIAGMQASVSWKLTAPLRALRRLLKQ